MKEQAGGSPPGLRSYLELRDRALRDGWTDGLDHALASCLDAGIAELADDIEPGEALVAVGGYGRGSLAIHSDVDLFFLNSGSGGKALTQRVLRPLWDASLKVGHITHTPRSARTFAGTRLDALCSLLTARLIVGDHEIFDDFRKRFDRLLRKERVAILASLSGEEQRRREAEPYRFMAADLKRGRGGLRTLDLIDWRRRLEKAGGDVVPVSALEQESRTTLMMARSALHAAANRLHDQYDFELRSPAAGFCNLEVAELGRQILQARRHAEQLCDIRAPAQASSPQGIAQLRPENRKGIGEGLESLNPDWERLRDLPHLVAFHRYPVADHTLACVDQTWPMIDGENDDPLIVEAITQAEEPSVLVWSAFFHDIGKGLGGDHSRVGAARVPRNIPGLTDASVEEVRDLVEHHLLLADLATRFDLDDPAVIARAADRIGTVRRLALLYLLTVADSSTAGTDTWSDWRAELVRRAYRQVERELAQRCLPAAERLAEIADETISVDPTISRSDVVAHLAGFTEAYRTSHSPEIIGRHVRMARRPLDPAGVLIDAEVGTPTSLTIVTTDQPGLVIATSGVLSLHRLSILDARFATRSDARVFDTFEVTDSSGGPVDEERIDGVRSDLARVLRGGYDLEGALASKQNAYRHTARSGVEPVVIIKASSDGGGLIEVECADRLGLLHDLAKVIGAFGMGVTRARVDTRAGIAYDVFTVQRLPANTVRLERALSAVAG